MVKWKTWQFVFLGYLLLLNLIIVCALSSFLINSDFLSRLDSTPATNLVTTLPPRILTITPIPPEAGKPKAQAFTPQPVELNTIQNTPTPVPPIDIPPAPIPGDK